MFEVLTGTSDTTALNLRQLGRAENGEDMRDKYQEALQSVTAVQQKLDSQGSASGSKPANEIAPSAVRAIRGLIPSLASSSILALQAQRDLMDKQLEEALQHESMKRDLRSAEVLSKVTKDEAKKAKEQNPKHSIMEMKSKVLTFKQSLVKHVESGFVSGKAKFEVAIAHAKELEDYEAVVEKAAILVENFEAYEKAAEDEKIAIDFMVPGDEEEVDVWEDCTATA